jgi:hypothetical protein
VTPRWLLAAALLVCVAHAAVAAEPEWENPVFGTADEAVAAALANLHRLSSESSPALKLFVDLTLAHGDLSAGHRSSTITRTVVDDILITHPASFADDDVQRRTIARFLGRVPGERATVERRLDRFGYPELPGLAYCRLVESVDAFAELGRSSTDRMSQVGGVTYYCRYMVLPLSYVGQTAVAELRRSAARNPSLDVDATVGRWQRESFASLINTFRHELVHVHTNSTLGVPGYRDRMAYPTWFHEGTATYLAADPHSGLSATYQQYQDLFLYLVQRHGVGKLADFYSLTLGGSRVGSALAQVYSISDSDELFRRAGRWHRLRELITTGLWIIALAIALAAIRGADRPYIGALQLLVAAGLGLGILTGLVEHVAGLHGHGVVLAGKLVLSAAAVSFAALGLRRIRRHRRGHAATA